MSSVTSADDMGKRAFDLLVASVGLILLLPIFVPIAALVKVSSRGPVFHRARRVGMGGALFTLFKFRSMVVNAQYLGPAITAQGDSRITSVGRFLRRTKLDELPQLLNVIKGDMSLVGPRPEDPRYVDTYTAEQRAILSVRPGITSAASVVYRHEEQLLHGGNWETIYREEILPRKLAIDIDYLHHQSWWSDIHIILRTLVAIGR
jgi:lipopolysaccharide/colanic/teichoic acid biosynthesis glycosyltransferase